MNVIEHFEGTNCTSGGLMVG